MGTIGKMIQYNIMFIYVADVLGGPHERRLLNDLLEHYNTLERPVYNESEPLQLLFGLTLQQIIDVVSIEWANVLCEKKIIQHLQKNF